MQKEKDYSCKTSLSFSWRSSNTESLTPKLGFSLVLDGFILYK